jgi:dolichyldiphosphatase
MPLSLITLTPPFLLVSYITLLLVRRELTILTSLIGQLGCEGLNLGLKRIFKQGRPTDFLGTGYGMPSSHSQFMGYFMAFWCLHLYRFRPGLTRARRAKEKGQRNTPSLVGVLRSAEHSFAVASVVILSLVTAYSR